MKGNTYEKILSFALCLIMVLTAVGFTASAQIKEHGAGEGYISLDFNLINGGIVNNLPNASITKNIEKDGISAVKIVPTPGTASGAAVNIDCHKVDILPEKEEIPK